jgi:hypothetical protein
MRRLYLPFAVLVGIAACSSPAKQDAAPVDRNSPALEPGVISMPSRAQTTASAVAETPKSAIIPEDIAQRMVPVTAGYSLATATMLMGDARVLGQLYAPNAVLRTPDSTVTGMAAVVRQLLSLARSKSLADFQRRSVGTRILDDSTLLDSGTYVMVLRRSEKDSVLERGRYAATWRARTDVTQWVILEDVLKPDQPAKAKGAK